MSGKDFRAMRFTAVVIRRTFFPPRLLIGNSRYNEKIFQNFSAGTSEFSAFSGVLGDRKKETLLRSLRGGLTATLA
jgi:hypothetical protein